MRGGIEINGNEIDICAANMRKSKVNKKNIVEPVNETSSIKKIIIISTDIINNILLFIQLCRYLHNWKSAMYKSVLNFFNIPRWCENFGLLLKALK